MGNRRSPYLILGVPYGASKNDAARAFARATRRLRRQSDAPYDLEDLNWALHAVEQRIQDPATSIDDFRMPADTSVYQLPAGEGILNPPATLYRRRTPPSDSTDLDALHTAVLVEIAGEVAAECRNTPLPALHYFPGDTGYGDSAGSTPHASGAGAVASAAAESRERPSHRRRALGVVTAALIGIAAIIAIAIGIATANSSEPNAEVVPSSSPVTVTPEPDDPAAMAFDAQFATDERAYDVCEDSCWIWDTTPTESCEGAEIEIGMYSSEDAVEATITRVQSVGRLEKGVVKRVVVPSEPGDPEFAAPLRRAVLR